MQQPDILKDVRKRLRAAGVNSIPAKRADRAVTTREEARQHIIAVDFDGTLCENAWPHIGEPRAETLARAKGAKERGCKLILWSCREGERLAEAVAWCAGQGLVFDAINTNLPSIAKEFGGDCRKVYANEYWDDRAVRI